MQKSAELCGFTDEGYRKFCDMVDPMHSACDVFNPLPDREKWQITEQQFRSEIQELFAKYKNKK